MAKGGQKPGRSLAQQAARLDVSKRAPPPTGAEEAAARAEVLGRSAGRLASPAAPTSPSGAPAKGVSRAFALASLQRAPSAPAPSRLPSRAPVAAASRRKYPRADLAVRARLSLADEPSRSFEATLATVDISVGGLFLQSSFSLKLGTRLVVTLLLPPRGREVRVKGEVVRVETRGSGDKGFALRFTEYFDGSEVALATHFLAPVLKAFITAYARQHRLDASAEYITHTADVLAAWELRKAELGGDVWALGQPET
jgi:hypothetical protein